MQNFKQRKQVRKIHWADQTLSKIIKKEYFFSRSVKAFIFLLDNRKENSYYYFDHTGKMHYSSAHYIEKIK